jgi:hypothetical protein
LGKRLGTNKKTKRGLKAWIPASAGMTEKRDFADEERLRKTKRDFGKKTWDK